MLLCSECKWVDAEMEEILTGTIGSIRRAGMVAFATLFAQIGSSQLYRVADTFHIHSKGAWDYVIFDPAERRLYVPHGSKIDVLDPVSGKELGTISDTPGVHGLAIVPGSHTGYVTNGHAGTVSVIDLTTLKHVEEIPAGKDPDSILFDSFTGRLFVSNGDSDDITIIDPQRKVALATIEATGAPEAAVSDGKGKVWVNLEDKNAIAEVNPQAMQVGQKTVLRGCSQPTSIAMDKVAHRIFIGCRNGVLAVYDPDSHRIRARLPIGLHVDGTIYDAERHFVFASSGDGLLTIYKQVGADQYTRVQQLNTARGAKTIALDPKTGTLFSPTMENVPSPSFGPPRASGPLSYPPRDLEILVIHP